MRTSRSDLTAGVPVVLAMDNSESNDAGHFLGEARLAFVLQRVGRHF